MSDKVENKNMSPGLARWEKPSLQRVGHVGEVFQMPGEGKLSIVADDMGDVQRKPKGQEDK